MTSRYFCFEKSTSIY